MVRMVRSLADRTFQLCLQPRGARPAHREHAVRSAGQVGITSAVRSRTARVFTASLARGLLAEAPRKLLVVLEGLRSLRHVRAVLRAISRHHPDISTWLQIRISV